MNHKYCPTCGQKISYEISLDKGTAEMIVEISKFIKQKGINVFSNTKEMIAQDRYNFHSAGNITKARAHGLIARIPNEPTNYCLTDKGIAFLKDEPIPSVAIILKSTKDSPSRVVGHEGERIKISQLLDGFGDYWVVNGYEIRAGRIINTPPLKSNPEYQRTLL